MMTPEFLRLASRMLNAFENDSASPETDYASIYLYHDGPGQRQQVTLGRGFTQFGGSLGMVLRRYITKGGQYSVNFQNALDTKFQSTALALDAGFLGLLRASATDPTMRDAQDEIFNEVYISPALLWASDRGFVLPLSNALIIDSYLHSGGMLDFLMKRFPEKKPVAGGDERAWDQAYVRVRRAWLASKGKPLSNTLYRMDFFLAQFTRDNWNFDPPMVANGSSIG